MPSGSHGGGGGGGSSSGGCSSSDFGGREHSEYSKRWYEPIYFKRNNQTYIIPKEGSVRLRDRHIVVVASLIAMIVFFISAFVTFHSKTAELIDSYKYCSTLVKEAEKNENLQTKGVVTELRSDNNGKWSISFEVPTTQTDQNGKQINARGSSSYIYSKEELPAVGDEISLAKSCEENLTYTDYIPMDFAKHSYKETSTYKTASALRAVLLIFSGFNLLLALLFMYLSVKLKNRYAKPEREYWKDIKNDSTSEKTCGKCKVNFVGYGLYCKACSEKHDAPDIIEREVTPKKNIITAILLILFILSFCVVLMGSLQFKPVKKEFAGIKSDRDYYLTMAKNAKNNSDLVTDGIVTNIKSDSENGGYYISYIFTASDGNTNYGYSFSVYKSKLDAPRPGTTISIATATKETTEHTNSVPLDYQTTRGDSEYNHLKNLVIVYYVLIISAGVYMVVWFVCMMLSIKFKKSATTNSSSSDQDDFIFSAKERLNAKRNANKKSNDIFDDFTSDKETKKDDYSTKETENDDYFDDLTKIDPDIFN